MRKTSGTLRMTFTRKCHAREGRPCTMLGKVMLPHDFGKTSLWKESGLLRYGRGRSRNAPCKKDGEYGRSRSRSPAMHHGGRGRVCAGCAQNGAGHPSIACACVLCMLLVDAAADCVARDLR